MRWSAQSLQAAGGLPRLQGTAALRGLVERVGAVPTRARLLALPRPQVECLTATLDTQPTARPLNGAEQLRDVLRELAAVSHHGIVDLVVGQQWGRTLFHHGRLLGAYHSDPEGRTVAPSLATLGRLAGSGPGTLYVRSIPHGALPRLHWPTAAPAAAPAAPAPTPLVAQDAERDERIETNLLWLLSHVERDRERAARMADADARVLPGTRAVHECDVQLYRPARGGLAAGRRAASAGGRDRDVAAAHALVAELEWRNGEIDAAALGRRYRSLPREGGYANGILPGSHPPAPAVDPARRRQCDPGDRRAGGAPPLHGRTRDLARQYRGHASTHAGPYRVQPGPNTETDPVEPSSWGKATAASPA